MPSFSRHTRRPFKRPTPERLEAVALRYLARYASTESRLRRVLKGRVRRAALLDEAFAADLGAQEILCVAIERIVQKHKASGSLDDASYAAMKTRSLRRTGHSARHIAQALAAKGVEPLLVAQALDEEEREGGSERAAAMRLAQKRRLGPWRPPEKKELTPKEAAVRRAKDVAVLARAGFSMDVIRSVLNNDGAAQD